MTSARTGAELPQGTIAIVTGASRGIGAATARALALSGATVVLAARIETELATIADQITEEGGRAFPCVADVTDRASVERLVQDTVATHGRVDIAFNNAGQGHQPKPLAELTVEEFDRTLSASARGVFLSMKHELAAMLGNDPPSGAIINMASTAGLRGVPGIAGYVAAKHAIIGLTETAALDYARQGIRVNAIAPGPIASHRLASLVAAARERAAAAVPLGRLGAVEEGGLGSHLAVLRSGVVHHRSDALRPRRQARRRRVMTPVLGRGTSAPARSRTRSGSATRTCGQSVAVRRPDRRSTSPKWEPQ
jgi:NAD(P)-dependent dehydrogenase (short-subunit alcohol dehydrogenase family)